MTLDVTIGKMSEDHKHVEECPKADFDVTNPNYSHWSRESYRSGSTGFWDFWMHTNEVLATVYKEMRRNPFTNDWDVAPLAPYAERIAALKDSEFSDPVDKDRLKWLQYWVAKAIELYGDKAGVSFYDSLNRCCWLVTEKGIMIHVCEGDLCHHGLKREDY